MLPEVVEINSWVILLSKGFSSFHFSDLDYLHGNGITVHPLEPFLSVFKFLSVL
jgi:hypothetical protein